MKCSFLDYVQLLMVGQVMKVDQNAEKGLLGPQKMKCSFLDYVQLLMIRAMKVISDDRSNESQPKYRKAPKSSKGEVFIFGLHSASDDWPSNPSNESCQKCTKNASG